MFKSILAVCLCVAVTGWVGVSIYLLVEEVRVQGDQVDSDAPATPVFQECQSGGAVCNSGLVPATFNFSCTWEADGYQHFKLSNDKTVATNMPCFIRYGVDAPGTKPTGTGSR